MIALALVVLASMHLMAQNAAAPPPAQATPPSAQGSPATAQATPPVTPAVAAPSADYVIGPSDVIAITEYDQTDLSGNFTVDADGTFTYPFIGRVKAGGLTLRDLEKELKKKLADGYFKDPQLSVSVNQYHSKQVFVVGEVHAPGSYPMMGPMTLIEALARAGSTLDSASEQIKVVRPLAAHAAAQGAAVPASNPGSDDDPADVIEVNLKALQSGDFSKNLTLHDGDTVFVPRADTIYVFGQVKAPGAYPIQPNTTVLQALSLAGGVSDRGSTSRIKVVRFVNGKKQELKVKLSDLVQPGDTIMVPQRFF
jgi:polysaccharide export outer membrane protein